MIVLSSWPWNEISNDEKRLYKQKAREFQSMIGFFSGVDLDSLEKECEAVSDFWRSILQVLPALFKMATKLLPNSSASVGRSFSLYNNILAPERRSLEEKTLNEALFLYFNSWKVY